MTCVFAGEALTRVSLPRILAALLHDQPDVAAAAMTAAAFVRPDYPPVQGTLAESLMLPETGGGGGLEGLDPLRRGLLASTRRDPDTPISLKRWNRLPPATRYLFALMAALEERPAWLLLEQKAFKKLSLEHREAALARIHSIDPPPRLLLIYSFIPDRLRDYMGDHFVLLRGGRVAFIGRREDYAELRERVIERAHRDRPDVTPEGIMAGDPGLDDADVLLD